MKVRRLEQADIPACIELGRQAHEESAYGAILPYSVEKCEQLGKMCLVDDNLLWLVAEDCGGQIVGMLGAYITEPFFSVAKIACDCLVYVSLGSRRAFAFIGLIRGYIDWALARKADVITLSTTQEDFDYYERLGFRRVGANFMLEVKS